VDDAVGPRDMMSPECSHMALPEWAQANNKSLGSQEALFDSGAL